MGRRSRFTTEHREWITDQLLRSDEAPRSGHVWRALYAAYLEQFPDARDVHGEAITLARYKKFVVYTETRQETDLVSRVSAHLRRHELIQQDEKALAETRRKPSEDESDSADAMEDAEVAIKSEAVDHSDDGDFEFVIVQRAPVPLLRTRATATATSLRADRKEQADSTAASSATSVNTTSTPRSALPPTPTSSTTATSMTPRSRIRRELVDAGPEQVTSSFAAVSDETTVAADASRKRQRIETLHEAPLPRPTAKAKPSTTFTSVQQEKPSRHNPVRLTPDLATRTERRTTETKKTSSGADEWRTKYQAEKAANEGLQTRLSEALTLLASQGRQLERLEASIAAITGGNAVSNSAGTPGPSALTFTISVNVDVSQNGQRLRTTTHALRVDATADADSASQV